jgi:chemotaxis protein histidine kinase CheA
MQTNLEQCPLCGTELSQTKFREIRAKLRDQEDRQATQLEEAKLAVQREAEQEFKKKLEQESRVAEKRARAEADKQVQKVIAENAALSGKLKAAEAREAEIRKEAQAEIEKQKELAAKRARSEFEEKVKKLALERDDATKKLKEAQAREVAIRKEEEQKAEKLRQKELAAQRQALDKDKSSALLKQQSEHNRLRESYQKKLKLMEQQLERKTANELGDGGEIEVLESLRDAFQGDRITPIKKGQPGADILHEVLYKGEVCGRIVTDSKVRQQWRDDYVTKLRKDKVEAKAEHAILATTVFRAGKKNLCIESDVIVASPGLVVHITGLLREAMITMHIKGLSMRERSNKMSQLYNLITSESHRKKFAEAERLAQDVLDLDVQEKKDHDIVWRKRGTMATRMKGVLRDMGTDVAAVIERADAGEKELPAVRMGKGASLLPSDFADATQDELGR